MDAPDERKRHKAITPLMGGMVLTCVILPLSVIAILFFSQADNQPSMLVYVAGSMAMALVGLADDRHSLLARDRLLVSVLIFVSVALLEPLFNIRLLLFDFMNLKIGLGTAGFAYFFTALCCIGLVNAVNMADGQNGLVLGLMIGWLALLSLRASPAFLPLILILISGLTVLWLFNIAGRLFLGDGGSYGIASATALIAIASYNSPSHDFARFLYADELMILFALPVIDSFRLSFVRVRQGRSPMSADRDHLHHHLEGQFGGPLSLFVYLMLSLGSGLLAFLQIVPSSILLLFLIIIYSISIRWMIVKPE